MRNVIKPQVSVPARLVSPAQIVKNVQLDLLEILAIHVCPDTIDMDTLIVLKVNYIHTKLFYCYRKSTLVLVT